MRRVGAAEPLPLGLCERFGVEVQRVVGQWADGRGGVGVDTRRRFVRRVLRRLGVERVFQVVGDLAGRQAGGIDRPRETGQQQAAVGRKRDAVVGRLAVAKHRDVQRVGGRDAVERVGGLGIVGVGHPHEGLEVVGLGVGLGQPGSLAARAHKRQGEQGGRQGGAGQKLGGKAVHSPVAIGRGRGPMQGRAARVGRGWLLQPLQTSELLKTPSRRPLKKLARAA